jgi:MoxR-like ATPase
MTDSPVAHPEVRAVVDKLEEHGYLADEGLATAIFLAIQLERPLLLEGDAGVGKTEVAKTLSRWLDRELIRLQCYEGIDIGQAVYEWDYARQLLHLRAAELRDDVPAERVEDELYSRRFLVRRPLLEAIDHRSREAPVLLIDEVDRADDEFEAFLLEVLSDYTISIPELGTISAARPPLVIITSNRTRDLHDALKRRCIYHWVEHPDVDREVAIVRQRAGVSEQLAAEIARAVAALRDAGLYKPPGVAESIDWARAVARLGREQLDERTARVTLGQVIKYHEDHERLEELGLAAVLEGSEAS